MPAVHTSHDNQLIQSRFLYSSAATTFALGLTVALYKVSRKPPSIPFFRTNHGHDPSFSPVLYAARALGLGTLLCLGSATVLIGLGRYVLDVNDLPGFSQKMRTLMKRTPVHNQLTSDIAREDPAGIKEWDRLWEEGRRIDADRAEVKRLKREKARQKNNATD